MTLFLPSAPTCEYVHRGASAMSRLLRSRDLRGRMSPTARQLRRGGSLGPRTSWMSILVSQQYATNVSLPEACHCTGKIQCTMANFRDFWLATRRRIPHKRRRHQRPAVLWCLVAACFALPAHTRRYVQRSGCFRFAWSASSSAAGQQCEPPPPLAVLAHCLSTFRRAFQTVYHLPCVSSSHRGLTDVSYFMYETELRMLWSANPASSFVTNQSGPRLGGRIEHSHFQPRSVHVSPRYG